MRHLPYVLALLAASPFAQQVALATPSLQIMSVSQSRDGSADAQQLQRSIDTAGHRRQTPPIAHISRPSWRIANSIPTPGAHAAAGVSPLSTDGATSLPASAGVSIGWASALASGVEVVLDLPAALSGDTSVNPSQHVAALDAPPLRPGTLARPLIEHTGTSAAIGFNPGRIRVDGYHWALRANHHEDAQCQC